MTIAGSDCCKLLIKTIEKDEKEIEVALLSQAAAKETSSEAAFGTVLLELYEEQRTVLKASLSFPWGPRHPSGVSPPFVAN